jgi:homoserine O-succinyltransferase/O-acetyltransferase
VPVLKLSVGTSVDAAQAQRPAALLPRLTGWSGSCIDVGLVNNMPDAALEATERQFVRILNAAAGEAQVRLHLFSLPAVPRSDTAREQLNATYCDIDELFNSRLDGLIVTGTEPRAACLNDEPYWASLTRVLEWAKENTTSTVWSCLAAHAAVLYLHGIPRHLLGDKLTGVFECTSFPPHLLVADLPPRIRVAHSRWNELRAEALLECNYKILTRSSEAGVDAFVKEERSLFVFFQGHPEYDRGALLREYRRDVGRFLRQERSTYPAMPRGYMDPVAADALARFQERAVLDRRESLLDSFPFSFAESRLLPAEGRSAVRLYGNWLSYLCAQREQIRSSRTDRKPLRLRRAGSPHSLQAIG